MLVHILHASKCHHTHSPIYLHSPSYSKVHLCWCKLSVKSQMIGLILRCRPNVTTLLKDGMMRTARSCRGTWVCWGLPLEVMLHCSAPQYEAYHLTLVWAFTSAEVYFAIWRAVEINGAVRVMALDGMQYTYRQWIVVTARVWTYWGRLGYE